MGRDLPAGTVKGLNGGKDVASSLLSRPLSVLFAVFATVFLVVGVLSAVPTAGAAPECAGGTYTNVRWKEGSPGVTGGVYDSKSEDAQVTFDWAVPDSAKPGDTFEITLPEQLNSVSTGPLQLRDSKGNIVATANVGGGKTVVFTLTDFVDTNFGVRGTAYFSVQWDRGYNDGQLGNEGWGPDSLHFGGCGSGALSGVYEKDGPSGIVHQNGKSGVYWGAREVDGKEVYLSNWGIAVGSDTNKEAFSVTDTAPAGWKFACDGKYNSDYSPVYVDFLSEEDPSGAANKHKIQNGNSHIDGGTTNVTGVTAEAAVSDGWNYHINCTESQLTVEFPYGVDPNTGPRISALMYSDQKPAPGSTVTNKVSIDGTEVEGYVVIPDAGGEGEGYKSGFVLKKNVTGLEESSNESFIFHWACVPGASGAGTPTAGSVSLAAGESHHVADVDKGLSCKVSEEVAEVEGYSYATTWVINGEVTDGKSVDFEILDPAEDSISVDITNAYSKALGGLKVAKKVVGLEGTDGADKAFEVTATCSLDGAEVFKKTESITDGEVVEFSDIAAGASCEVSEDVEGAEVEGYTLTSTIDPRTVDIVAGESASATVINTYTPTPLGGFTIAKSLKADVTNHAAPWADKVFTFDYTCQFGDEAAREGTLELKPGESENVVDSVGELKVGTTCSVTERDAAVENFDWTTEWDVKGADDIQTASNSTTFTIGSGVEGQAVAIGVENIYTAQTGSFDIVKTISGEAAAAAASQEFSFDYSCTIGEEVVASGTASLVGAGTVTVDDVPLAADCTVSEKPVNVKDTALNVTITPEKFRISDNPDGVAVTVDNEFTYVNGGLIITKFVTGNAMSHAPDEFRMNYRCVAPSNDTPIPPADEADPEGEDEPSLGDELEQVLRDTDVTVGGKDEKESFAATQGEEQLSTGQVREGTVTLTNGKSAVIEGIIPGSECEVWEDSAPAKNSARADWSVSYLLNGQPAGEPVKFTVVSGENAQVIVENEYTKTPQNGLIIIPIPVPIPGGGSSLPPTGSSGSSGSSTTEPQQPAQPGKPGEPAQPGKPGEATPVKEQQAKSKHVLAETGANVLWAGGIALLLMAVGALLALRGPKNES